VRALARGLFAKQREQRAAGSKGIAEFDCPEELGKSVEVPGIISLNADPESLTAVWRNACPEGAQHPSR